MTNHDVYLHFGDSNNLPMVTRAADGYKYNPLPHHTAGLSYTATGYGAKIPTPHMVLYDGRWRRVYVAQYSNAGSAYVIVGGEKISVSLH